MSSLVSPNAITSLPKCSGPFPGTLIIQFLMYFRCFEHVQTTKCPRAQAFRCAGVKGYSVQVPKCPICTPCHNQLSQIKLYNVSLCYTPLLITLNALASVPISRFIFKIVDSGDCRCLTPFTRMCLSHCIKLHNH